VTKVEDTEILARIPIHKRPRSSPLPTRRSRAKAHREANHG
jgi:hypothetical protein